MVLVIWRNPQALKAVPVLSQLLWASRGPEETLSPSPQPGQQTLGSQRVRVRRVGHMAPCQRGGRRCFLPGPGICCILESSDQSHISNNRLKISVGMQLDHCLTPNTKLHSGWIIDPNPKPRAIGASRTGGQTFPIRSHISTILGLKDTIPQLCFCGVKVATRST